MADLDLEQLAKASMHPLQICVLELAASGEKVSPVDLEDDVGVPLGNCAYHVRVLHERGLLKKAGTKRRRGAIQHYYVLTAKALR
ncbi:MAG: hypothetical protein QOJ29_763 [Thermoleophilaceae bacterium]|nr:hypothetical protein [Thermoleophilaceae bacterium]